MRGAHRVARGGVRRDDGHEDDDAVAREQPRDESDPRDVGVAVGAAEAEVGGQVGAQFVAVQDLDAAALGAQPMG
jgi:hypothetical protein